MYYARNVSVSAVVRTTPHLRAALDALAALDLPDAWIGAGALRNAVWDVMHGRAPERPSDVDVVYFDPEDDGFQEHRIEAELSRRAPAFVWEVRNQTRMHARHGHAPYRCTAEAISYWVETATAVAVRQIGTDRYEFLAPHGLGDLESLRLRAVSSDDRTTRALSERAARKRWVERWPLLSIES
ncbi:nucleotidyltransferase family protein [Rhodovibrio salinarum]|uniref:Nucleotidyltransferase family protein n=1 Tax=Rhodovibrio salinarum TaxID=1087 RepID=A0A934V1B6_9PROT|nr:nucleotidyltransferase family protein [Rhodovibrio salinarum]MBK1697994.1 hypothetical protein [Rhodovibrio salinarum]